MLSEEKTLEIYLRTGQKRTDNNTPSLLIIKLSPNYSSWEQQSICNHRTSPACQIAQ